MRGKEQRPASRVLVIKRDGLRQFVEAEPAFSAIRQAHPGATIDLLTNPLLQRLAKSAPCFDRVLATRALSQKGDKQELVGQLKRQSYEVVYDLDGTKESMDLRGALRGFRGPNWIGPKRPLSEGKRSLAPTPLAGPAMRKLLRSAGVRLDERLPDLTWSARVQETAANLKPDWFGLPEHFGLLIPASNPMHRWPAERYAELVSSLAQKGITAVFIGPSGMVNFADDVIDRTAVMGKLDGRAPVNLCGKTDAAQLAIVGQKAKFFVAGPAEELHLVTSVGLGGIVVIPPSEDISGDALFGRNVVKLTSSRLGRVEAGLALQTLGNMGLLSAPEPRPTVAPVQRSQRILR